MGQGQVARADGGDWIRRIHPARRVQIGGLLQPINHRIRRPGNYNGVGCRRLDVKRHKLADDMCMPTPALVGDRLLIQTAVRLYCIRAKEQS